MGKEGGRKGESERRDVERERRRGNQNGDTYKAAFERIDIREKGREDGIR